MKYISTLLLYLMTTSCVQIMKCSQCTTCSEPQSIPDTSTEYMMNNSRKQSYSITPGWQYNLEHAASKVPNELIDIKLEHFHGDMKCPNEKKRNKKTKIHSMDKTRHSNQENTLNKFAQCPWRYVENIDKNRKPETFLEAKCLCTQPVQSGKKNDLVCQGVMEYISVLRRTGCENGVWVYEQAWEPRTVACVASTLPEPEKLYTVAYKMFK